LEKIHGNREKYVAKDPTEILAGNLHVAVLDRQE
jgi:hypothetical protein